MNIKEADELYNFLTAHDIEMNMVGGDLNITCHSAVFDFTQLIEDAANKSFLHVLHEVMDSDPVAMLIKEIESPAPAPDTIDKHNERCYIVEA